MITIYIKEWENEEICKKRIPECIKKIMFKIIKNVNIIISKEIDKNKKIYFVPDINSKKVYQKIRKKLEKETTKTQKVQVVLSNKLKQYRDEFKKYKIVEGKKILKESIEKILKMILQDNPLAMQDIYIVANKYCEGSVSLIKGLSSKVKNINIITKEIKKFMILEDILSEEGIAVCIANNKKKSLKKAKIIINFDFSEEELKKYTIYRNSIIINLSSNKIKQLKAFDGIILQDIELKLKEEDKQWLDKNSLREAFRKLEIYESLDNLITTDKIQIDSLYGNNGKIDKKELINMQKILTN